MITKFKQQDYQIETNAVRAGSFFDEIGAHSEPIYLSSSFRFENAAQAAARFQGNEDGFVYSRFANPTVQIFEQRIAVLEYGQWCVASATGMSAILTTCLALLKKGDHVVSSLSQFGSTTLLLTNYLAKFGIESTFVSLTDINEWENAITDKTRLILLETPSNPLMEIADIKALAEIAHHKKCLLVVDNTCCTPILQNPLLLNADIVIHSTTKYIDGQGRSMGGAIIGNDKELWDTIYSTLRTTGSTMSPFNAWVALKGLETLQLRIQAHCNQAKKLAYWLDQQSIVNRVYYPGLPTHPQHALSKQQQKAAGATIAFEVAGKQSQAWSVIDNTKLFSITANLGDTKSTITHPASTTHCRLSKEQRDQAGVHDNLIRISVGLENFDDIQNDLEIALNSIT